MEHAGTKNLEQFVRSFDDTRLFVEEAGRRRGEAPTVILNDGLGCDGFIWRYLRPALARDYHVVHWHYRGHGLSRIAWDHPHVSMEALKRDLLAVMDALSLERAVLLGHSMGVQVILDFALDHPERVAGLVPVCGSYGRPLDTFHGNNGLGLAFPYLHGVVRRFPRGAQRFWTSIAGLDLAYAIASTLEVNGRAIQRSDFQPYFDHLAAMDVRVFMRVLDSVRDHSVEDRLSQLTPPTLIVAGDRDTFTPVHLSRRMAELIPDAELLVLPSGSHIAPLEHRDVLELRVQRFLGKVLAAPRQGAARARSTSAHPQ